MGRMPWATRRVGRNHACQRPAHFVFVDTETNWNDRPDADGRTRHSLRLGCACSVVWPRGEEPAEDWLTFGQPAEFWDWLRTKQVEKRVVWVVAHNAVFDLTILNLWEQIETGEYRIRTQRKVYRDPRTGQARESGEWCGLVALDGHPFHIETQGFVGRVNFSDLMNYYKCSLEKIGRTVGLEKLPRPGPKDGPLVWAPYCRRDVEITKRAYLSLCSEWQRQDNGNWSLSGPGLAWNCYRHRHMANPVVLHSHAEARDLEWQSYHPGECRAFYRGRVPGPVVHLDINSLYPSLMLTEQFPTELIDYQLAPNPTYMQWLLDTYLCIAEVDVVTDTDSIPFRSNRRALYPVGRFRTALAGPELVRAWAGGYVRHVRRVAFYRGARLFDSFVGEWWQRRREALGNSDLARSDFCKLMMNSLPGKFAQRNPTWRFDERVTVVRPWRSFPWRDPDTGCIYNARSIGWHGQYADEREDAANCFPAIGAFLTSYGRERMRLLRSLLPPRAIYYQDTDSLLVAGGLAELLTAVVGLLGDDLGQVRTVGRYDSVTIRGPKNYSCDGKHTIAGVKVSDEELGANGWTGIRFETGPQIVTREPDWTVRTWRVNFDTPGTCLEGGYTSYGWYSPIKID